MFFFRVVVRQCIVQSISLYWIAVFRPVFSIVMNVDEKFNKTSEMSIFIGQIADSILHSICCSAFSTNFW